MTNIFRKRMIGVWIAALLCISLVSASAVSEDALSLKLEETAAHLGQIEPQVGSIGGEWVTLGLTRAGRCTQQQQAAYQEAAQTYVRSVGSEKLHTRKSTDNSRVILALSATGFDARNTAGYDLTKPLSDMSYAAKQGVNGAFWALIALDSCDYPCDSRDALLESILSAQHADGGWGLDDSISDPDMTAMALTALAPYRSYDAAVQRAAEQGIDRLISLQAESGGYSSYDLFNPESCAQVIVALCSMGIDPTRDERFCKGGKTLFDSVMRFSVEGGFAHSLGGSYNELATEQVFYAMTAYDRLQNGQTALFDMTDKQSFAVYDFDGDGVESINDVTHIQRWLAEFDVQLTTAQRRLADMNRNGRVDIGDVTAYQKRLAQ